MLKINDIKKPRICFFENAFLNDELSAYVNWFENAKNAKNGINKMVNILL